MTISIRNVHRVQSSLCVGARLTSCMCTRKLMYGIKKIIFDIYLNDKSIWFAVAV